MNSLIKIEILTEQPEEIPKVIARVKAEPLDIVKQDNARDNEDLSKVDSFNSFSLVALKLDARILRTQFPSFFLYSSLKPGEAQHCPQHTCPQTS